MHLHQQQKRQAAIKAILERHKAELLSHQAVKDIGVGFRIVDHQLTDELCAIIHLAIPKGSPFFKPSKNLPTEIEGIPVDYVEALEPEILRSDYDELHPHIRDISNFRDQLFPQLIGGIRIKNARNNGQGGTLGAVVYDRQTNEPYGLTSRHVLLPDRSFRWQKKAIVIQPSHHRNKRSEIGWVEKNKEEDPDCIRFRITAERPIAAKSSCLAIKGLIKGIASEVLCGTKVMKSGARTGVTYGIIVCESICKNNFTIYPDDDYDLIDGELTLPGDSGAVWMTNDGHFQAIGLHCLGNRSKVYDAEMAVALNMNMVADYLNIRF